MTTAHKTSPQVLAANESMYENFPILHAKKGEWPLAVKKIIETYQLHHPKGPFDRIAGAYALAEAAHFGQLRKSGEPYIIHPLAVAQMSADLGLDEASIAAAICHDTVEDCDTTLEELAATLGSDVAFLVDGLTKLDKLRAPSPGAAQAATLRKLLVAVAKDVRVLIIKLCDRLHNMSTIKFLSNEKALRIATETLEVYAPLAHRLGMGEIKWQLEDLAFEIIHPDRYNELQRLVASLEVSRKALLDVTIEKASESLKLAGVEAEVTGRAKHLWSIYEKMVVRNKDFADIHDLVGIRIITKDVKDCYGALGTIHSLWTPIPGRFKDFIATPKFNLYQSIHTTVLGPTGKTIEVQLRTREMHDRAESGVAAHWDYKNSKRSLEKGAKAEPAWLQRLLEGHSGDDDPEEFMDGLRRELAAEEVVCFTPAGDVIALPVGALPLDFAYAVHSEVGHACIGAKVNGKIHALSSPLFAGDTVEVLLSKSSSAGPKRDWLKLVTTPRAKQHIKARLSKESKEDAILEGQGILQKAFRLESLPTKDWESSPALQKVAHHFNAPTVNELLADIGRSKLSASLVASRMRQELEGNTSKQAAFEHLSPSALKQSHAKAVPSSPVVHVDGMSDVLVRLSVCCNPAFGDDIIGYVTKARGVSVHRSDCINAAALAAEFDKMVDVEWLMHSTNDAIVTVSIEAFDRPGLLSDVTTALTHTGVNISHSSTSTGADRVARQAFTFAMADQSHLDSVLDSLRQVSGVCFVKMINLQS